MTQSLSLPDWLAGRRLPGTLDVVVVGSGYGGAVAARRLAERGHRVVLLERGAEYLPGDFPNDVGQLPLFLRGTGPRGPMGSPTALFDWHVGAGATALVANGLGGGSLINAGVMMRPEPEVFAQPAWPAELRLDAGRPGEPLDEAFAEAERRLGGMTFGPTPAPTPMPPELPKSAALRRLGEAMREQRATRDDPIRIDPATVTIDLAKCTRCGDCFTGCNVPGAKRTLGSSYLDGAVQAGAQLVTRALVYAIEPHSGPGGGWTLRVLDTAVSTRYRGPRENGLAKAERLHGVRLHAREVVLAAGSLGSTELLLRSREEAGPRFALSPALGSRFSANGDGLSMSIDEAVPVDSIGHGAETLADKPPVGPTITTVLDLRSRPALEQRIVVQDCAVPGALRRVMQEGLATVWALQHLGSSWRTPRHAQGPDASDPLAASPQLARHTQVLLAMGHDRSAGRVVWVPGMNAAVPFWPKPDEVSSLQRQETVFEAARALGGLPLPGPWWRALPDSATEVMSGPKPDPMLLTVHPLGGCVMGDEFEHSVVNHLGQVWSGPQTVHEGLSVLDGAIVPTSLGCNPLWTITALAERAMALRNAAGQQAATAPATGAPRSPQPLQRAAAPPTALVLRERLTLRELPLPRGLRRALGHATADTDLELALRHPDAERLWDSDRRHRIDDVQGRLRLAVPASPRTDAAGPPGRMLSYQVTGGSMELLAPERWWQGLAWPLLALLLVTWRAGPLMGLLAGLLVSFGPFVRTVLTWFILRGWRELCSNVREEGLAGLWRRVRQGGGLIAMWRHAGVQRHVRYDLQLERCNATGGLVAPSKLRVEGDKTLRYAATWSELLRHIVRRLVLGPQRVRPGDLRETWFEQLTKPWLSVRESGPLGWPWARWPGRGVRHRFDFDIRALLQQAPMQIEGGADSGAGIPALIAYPLLIGRVAMLTRLLDLRLPDYSGRIVVDAPTDYDLVLRCGPAKAAADVVPEPYTVYVPRGDSSNDDGSESVARVELKLLRYRRRDEAGQVVPCGIETGRWHDIPVRRAKCVLMLHAFGMSSLAFTFKQTEANFAEHLYAEGYEVWLLDSRISPRVADGYRPSTLDQHGLRDVPGAVDCVLDTLAEELGAGDWLQIGMFAHCMGAGGALMALLAGRLSYPIAAGGLQVSDAHARQLPKLAALVCSQVHPYMVGSRNTQAKTWIASLLRDLAGRTLLPLAVRGPVHSLLDATVDRVFASLPVPEGERCPDEGSARRRHDDDCATCRRIRFFDGQLFGHRQLNRETHEALPRLFGDGNVRLFAHAGRVVEYERLVSEDGFNAYVTDSNIRRYLGLPLRFVHGAENDLFNRESAERSAIELLRLHPDWAACYGKGSHGVADVIDDYGHLDVLIGQRAAQQTYGRLSALFKQALVAGSALPAQDAPERGPIAQVVRLPLAGPWMGPAERQPDGALWWPVAFLVDDRQAEGGGFHERAVAHLVGRDAGGQAIDRWFLLEIERVDAPLVAIDGHRLPEGASDGQGGPSHGALRIASGVVSVPEGAQAVAIECMSANPAFGRPADHEPDTLAAGVAAARLEPRHGRDSRPLSGSLDLPSDVLARLEAAVAKAPAVDAPETPRPKPIEDLPSNKDLIDALRRGLADTLAFERERRQVAEQPFPPTVSMARLEPLDPERRWVHPPPVPPTGPTGAGLRVAAMTCAYPGTPWDRDRASASHARLHARCTAKGAPPSFGFLLGDQIYADATAGLVDPLSPVERYGRRHEQAWRARGLRALMQRLPLVMTPDDHEFANAYPDGAPLYRGDEPVGTPPPERGQERESPREAAQRGHAESVLELFQLSTAPRSAIDEGWHAFEAGGVRFFVADTRRFRTRADQAGTRILSTAARAALHTWITAGASSPALHCFVSGSVVLPGLVPASEPGQYAPTDTWQAAPVERAWLLELLTTHLRGRFVLLSGDYHVSWSGPVRLNGQVVGAAVVAPPVYAPLPYANAMPSSVWRAESITLATGTLTLGDVAAARGSGHGLLTMQRDAQGGWWLVGLETELFDMERGGTWETVNWPTVVLS